MNKVKLIIAAVSAVLLAVSCKSQYEMLLNSNDADAKYNAAFQYFEQEKFSKAAALFESLSVLTNGTERDEYCAVLLGVKQLQFQGLLYSGNKFFKIY